MGRYIVLTNVSESGLKRMRAHGTEDAPVPNIAAEVESFGGKVIDQFAMLGEYDFCTIIEAPDNAAAQSISVAERGADVVTREVLPAIDLNLFTRLLTQETETTGPYRWQISWWARLVRPFLRWWESERLTLKVTRPLRIQGRENFKGLKGPALFIANHSSHLDQSVLYLTLPWRYRLNVAYAGAADRFFLKGRKGIRKQGWWFSLAMSTYPLHRGGGRAALEYTEWLIDHGASIAIFPEGTRSTTGKLSRFRAGPAILALGKDLPVVPMYFDGLREIRPKGTREMKPGPVIARIGKPLRFAPGTSVSEATHAMQKAVEQLRDEVRHYKDARGLSRRQKAA